MNRHQPISRSGRFASGPARDMTEFSESVSFDWRLWRHDILGSIAHARMLRRVGLIRPDELDRIVAGLRAIARSIAAGRFHWDPAMEDVHMNIESALTRYTPAGAKLHTGRSRNDQIALDIRLWLRDELVALDGELAALQRALLDVAKKHTDVLIPGYTHLQRAQPVYLAHHLLAYVEMFQRDRQRLADCFQRVNVCPLGSGAIAGSTLPLNRESVAVELGFVDNRGRPRITTNSMDAVADRDFAVEFCACAAILAMHMSRLAEDIILWSTAEFGFIRISDAYTTGSSLMPQKRNPDAAELVRGKTGRVTGDLVALLTVLKALPMSYNRDLQEDKPPLFDAADTARACVRIMAGMLGAVTVNTEACAKTVSDPALLATDMVDRLVLKGVPFREAHHMVGAVVAAAEKLGKPLNQLTQQELKQVDPRLSADLLDVFDLTRAMQARRMPGAPSRTNIRSQLARWHAQVRKPLVTRPPGPYTRWLP